MIRRALPCVAFALLAAVLGWAGHALLFTTFMIYDDEGYVLLSLRNYGLHGRLYDEVFSQYGPAFFALYDGLARLLRFAWDNTAARWLTLVLWLATAGFAAAAVRNVARNLAAALLTFAAVFTYLWIMIHEPSHPGGLVGLVVALGAWLGCRRDPATHPATAAALGATGVVLLLTKINVGVFFLTAAGGWLLAHASAPSVRRIAGLAVAAWVALLPFILMQGLFAEPWVRAYAALGSLGAAGVWVVLRGQAAGQAGSRSFGAMLGAAGVAAGGVVLLTLARGTCARGLLDGVLLEPLRHPRVYSFAFPWRPGALPSAAIAFGLALLAAARPGLRPRLDSAVIALRGAGLLAFCGSAFGLLPVSLPALGMTFTPALAILCAWPLSGTDAAALEARARRWLAWLLALQFLHGYPVAGSQINWGTFLLLPLLVLGAMEAWTCTQARLRLRPTRLVPVAAAALALVMAGFMTVKLGRSARFNQRTGEALDLPGAEKILAADEVAFAMQALSRNARVHGDRLFSLPGAYSFNLWTGLPTPTLANATQWFNSLDDGRQQAIVASLSAAARPVIIVQQDVLRLLVRQGHSSDGPLARYLLRDYAPVFSLDGYAFWAKRGRKIAPVGVARWPSSGQNGEKLSLIVPAAQAAPTRLDLWAIRPGGREPLGSVAAGDAGLRAERIDAAGEPSAAGEWVRLTFAWPGPRPAGGRLLLCLVDAEGRRLDAVRILP